MSFPRYPKYKPSGVEWLGEVPVGWGLKRLRYVCYCLDGSRVPLNSAQRAEKQGDVPYWGANSIMDYVDEALFDEDLVLLGEDGAPFFDKLKPVAFFSQGKVWPNNHVHVLRPVVAETAKFITYALNITDFANFIDGSTRDKLTQGAMKEIPLPFPPFPEQTAIANFLDHETAKIDALIAEQQRLIELLKEKRQAVISHAVTKGLDPNVRMKDSGVEWLGEVPVGWRIVQLRMLAKMIQTGPFGSQLHSEDYVVNGIPVINPSNIQDGKIEPDWSCSITAEDANRLSQHKLIDGDIVFGRRGEMGRCALVSATELGWICGTGSLNVRLLPEVFPPFISIYLRTEYVREWLKLESVGSTMDNLNTQILGAIKLPLPNLSEQTTIVAYLETELAKFDTLTIEAQRAISFLQERRTALISAAVTGQIDVRGFTPVAV